MKRHCCNHYDTITPPPSDVELILNTPREKKEPYIPSMVPG